MALIHIHRGRGISKEITILDGDGDTVTPGANDVLRIKIGYEGLLDSAPILSFASNSASANGSTITKNSPSSGINTMRLDDADTALIPAGVYTLSVELVDNADSNDLKQVSRQVFSVEES